MVQLNSLSRFHFRFVKESIPPRRLSLCVCFEHVLRISKFSFIQMGLRKDDYPRGLIGLINDFIHASPPQYIIANHFFFIKCYDVTVVISLCMVRTWCMTQWQVYMVTRNMSSRHWSWGWTHVCDHVHMFAEYNVWDETWESVTLCHDNIFTTLVMLRL